MPRTRPFHTSEPETAPVYDNNSECFDGQKIKPEHYVEGEGVGRRLCDVCADLNRRGRWPRRPTPNQIRRVLRRNPPIPAERPHGEIRALALQLGHGSPLAVLRQT
jgi:hypothetical protein